MNSKLIPTTVVGSYPQPDWLVDKELLQSTSVPRVRMTEIWRVAGPYLEEAQDDATVVAIRDMERAGIDVITDGEIRRESYSNRFATALDGMDAEPALVRDGGGGIRRVPRIVGPVRRTRAVEVRDMEFLRRNTDRATKITLPGPFSIAKQASNEFYRDEDEAVMDLAAAINEEALALEAAGAGVIQLDEPWLRLDLPAAERIGVAAIDRAFRGVTVTKAVHVCFGYAAKVTGRKPASYSFLTQLADSVTDQISIESAQPGLDLGVIKDLTPKQVILGVIDLATQEVETAEEVCARLQRALDHLPASHLIAAPDCGMKYLPRAVAFGKLRALAAGAELARQGLR